MIGDNLQQKDLTDLNQWIAVHRSSDFTPEKKLMAAILIEAAADLSNPHEQVKARHWLLHSNSGYLYSLPTICDYLNLDINAVRQWVIDKKPSSVMRRRYLRNSRISVLL